MEKKYSVGKSVLKTSLITALIAVVAVIFVALGFYVINPRLSAQICSSLGWKNFEVSCYELVYARSKEDADLYNLIVKIGGVNQTQKQLDYINKFKNSTKYNSFCENLDNSIVENYKNAKISAKNMISLYGINEYITSSEILDYVVLNNYEKAYELAKESKNTDKTYEVTIYYYLDYLNSNQVAENVKANYASKIKTEAIENLDLKDSALSFSNAAEQILCAYAKVKIKYSKYVLYELTNDASAESAKAEWKSAVIDYNKLVK